MERFNRRRPLDVRRGAVTTPALGAVLLLVAGMAGFVILATSLLVPTIGRAGTC
jgi:hypothetical protein